jgi:hypothetical protein
MTIKTHHHSFTHFETTLLQILVAQNNALWAIAEELNKMNDRPKDWSHIDKGVQ